MIEFINNPIQFLLDHCTKPVVDLELFNPGHTVPVISGADVNKFVYSHPDLWDYGQGRQAFREAFGDRYITLLSGAEYHEKQRQLQYDLRVELDEEALRIVIRGCLDGRQGEKLSHWARKLAIWLLWHALHPCDPVPLGLLDSFEYYFVKYTPDNWALKMARSFLVGALGTKTDEEFCDKVTPFIAGIRALSTSIEWLVLGRMVSPPADLPWILRHRPPLILFPLYLADDFEIWIPYMNGDICDMVPRRFVKGQLIFHAMCVEQWRDPKAELALFGGGVHKCPGRHLVKRLLQLVLWELSMTEGLKLVGGGNPMDAKFNGLLVPAYDWRFTGRRY